MNSCCTSAENVNETHVKGPQKSGHMNGVANLEWCHKSFSFLAAKLWNSLPTYVRNAKDISTFKRLLKKQVFG